MNEGDAIPASPLILADGTPVDLAGLTGHPLVVYFYPKADTPGCTNEAKDFSQLAPEFDALAAKVIGVSKDKPAKLAKFAAKYDLGVLLASDADGTVIEDWGVWIEKSMYGKKYMGIERATFLFGADGRCARVWHGVKVKGHAEEVLAAARGL